ncbi:MAG: hypothetical protein RJB39_243 [Candidatus Parcubacteria bacterium]|jgi:uncharacterized membrane protein
MFFLALIVFIILYFIFSHGLRTHVDTLENRVKFLETQLKSSGGTINTSTSTQPVAMPVQTQTTATTVGQFTPLKPQDRLPVQESAAHSMETFATRIAKLGIVVLAIGVLYFLSYINSKGLVGPTAKFAIGLIAGAACIAIAEWVKRKSLQYAQILRGGGFIIWYITLYVGTFTYHIVSLPVTLGLIIGVLLVSVIISFAEKKDTSFFIGVLGAYIVPWIAGVANHDGNTNLQLLVYTCIISCGIIAVSLVQNWKKSMYAGFIFTWMMFASIYSLSLDSWSSVQLGWKPLWLFATLFGLQYLIVFIIGDVRRGRLYAAQTADATTSVVPKVKEGEVFLTATNTFLYAWFAYFLVQPHFGNYIGFLTLILGVFHLCVYLFIRNMQGNTSPSVSSLTHFVIFIVLATAAIPMQFDGPIVTMVWFIEGIVLAYMATTKEFKNRGVMYVLALTGIIMGIIHMIAWGSYKGVSQTGIAVFNQQYLVWFFVAVLVHVVAYLWKNIDIQKVKSFALFLFLLGQVFFVILSSVEIWSYYQFKSSEVYAEQRDLDKDFEATYGYSRYDSQVTPAQEAQLNESYQVYQTKVQDINNTAAFVNAIFFVIMTAIYLLIGLLGQNKLFRRLGVVMLIVTLLQIISLVWRFGPVYRFVTFSGFGIVLLVLSYLYIHHSKKITPINETK